MSWWSWLLIAISVLAVAVALAARSATRNEETLRQLLRFVPDCLGLFRDLVRDPEVPRRAKLVAAGTVLYLALPIDLVPDLVPGLGYLDDVLIVAWAIRHVIASTGRDRVATHWRGDPATLERILRLARVG